MSACYIIACGFGGACDPTAFWTWPYVVLALRSVYQYVLRNETVDFLECGVLMRVTRVLQRVKTLRSLWPRSAFILLLWERVADHFSLLFASLTLQGG